MSAPRSHIDGKTAVISKSNIYLEETGAVLTLVRTQMCPESEDCQKKKRVDKASDAEHINSEQIERSAIVILLQEISRIF